LALEDAERREADALLSPDEQAFVQDLRDRREAKRFQSQANRIAQRGNNILPRTAKTRVLPEDDDADDTPAVQRAKAAVFGTKKRGRDESEPPPPRRGRQLDDGDGDVVMGDGGDKDDLPSPTKKQKKTTRGRSLSRDAHRSASRPPARDESAFANPAQKAHALKVSRKMHKLNRLAKAGEGIRKTGPKLERWRLEGKMFLKSSSVASLLLS